MSGPAGQIAFDDFLKVDVRVGQVLAADPFPEARKPAYRLTIDFGPDIGVKKSSARSPSTTPRTTARPQGRRRGQFSAAPDRALHVRGPDPRFSRRSRRVVLVGVDRDVPLGGRLF
jgi:tRNA-binding protein